MVNREVAKSKATAPVLSNKPPRGCRGSGWGGYLVAVVVWGTPSDFTI
ncbi:MAG TPA: hypothetical protein VMW72_15065 [Sedimentisphaerales bacterium]|nr:hypothetical protein [Sedimentisphaerales bacterium]